MAVYLFNPENDMALANFTPYYRPPAEIGVMASDLALLPAWYAVTGSVVKVGEDESEKEFLERCGTLCPDVRLSGSLLDMPYRPWGWSPALVHTLQSGGVSLQYLPDTARLEKIRQLSCRRCAGEVLEKLQSMEGCCGLSAYVTSLESVRSFLERYVRVIFKSPWSGSGRGLVTVTSRELSASYEGWISRIIRTQGGIMAEPLYDKVVDFAMEFYSDGKGEMKFVGYSLFDTDTHGNYKGNFLMSDQAIVQALSAYVSPDLLTAVRTSLLEILVPLLGGDYRGYFGVDMMICRDNGRYLLHPCVEINLRMNMGVVSHILYERLICPDVKGRFHIVHFTGEGECLDFYKTQCGSFPLELDKGRIVNGYFALTPVGQDTRYHACLHVGGSF